MGLEEVIHKDKRGAKLANVLDADGYIIFYLHIWRRHREMKMASQSMHMGTKAVARVPSRLKLHRFVEKQIMPTLNK